MVTWCETKARHAQEFGECYLPEQRQNDMIKWAEASQYNLGAINRALETTSK